MGIDNLSSLGYVSKPKVFGYYFPHSRKISSLNTQHHPKPLPTYLEKTKYDKSNPTKRNKVQVPWTIEDQEGQEMLTNEDLYNHEHEIANTNYLSNPECVPMHPWQTRTFPTCNLLHERDMADFSISKHGGRMQIRNLAAGYFRDLWQVFDHDNISPIALKTMHRELKFNAYNYDKHRMDAVATERLTSDPFVMDIYGFCGLSSLNEFANEGTLHDYIFDDENSDEIDDKFARLRYALQVAQAIASLHESENILGHASIVHADITTDQFLWNSKLNRYNLNDFNRCQFMYWNSTSNTETCPYIYSNLNAGEMRSPEEYRYSYQTEAIDVYSMGNVFYTMLMRKYPYSDQMKKEEHSAAAQKLVLAGKVPKLSKKLKRSNNPLDIILIEAMKMCHIYNWRERATAGEVRDFLESRIKDVQKKSRMVNYPYIYESVNHQNDYQPPVHYYYRTRYYNQVD